MTAPARTAAVGETTRDSEEVAVRTVTCAAACSLDGFITDGDGALDWRAVPRLAAPGGAALHQGGGRETKIAI